MKWVPGRAHAASPPFEGINTPFSGGVVSGSINKMAMPKNNVVLHFTITFFMYFYYFTTPAGKNNA